MDAALDLLPELDDARAHVAGLASAFRDGAAGLGFDVGASQSQIVPLIVGEAGAALALADRLSQAGIWATAIRPPTVPKGAARLRIAFSAAHSEADLERLLTALAVRRSARRSA